MYRITFARMLTIPFSVKASSGAPVEIVIYRPTKVIYYRIKFVAEIFDKRNSISHRIKFLCYISTYPTEHSLTESEKGKKNSLAEILVCLNTRWPKY